MASPTRPLSILLLGDSYVHDGQNQTWPLQLVGQIGGAPHNFAQAGSKSDALGKQIEKFLAKFKASNCNLDAVIVHVGGNDLLENLKATMDERGKSIADTVCQNIKGGLESLIKTGVEYFVVADVPFSTRVPHIRDLIQGYADEERCDFAEAEHLAIAFERALNQKISLMIQGLCGPDVKIIDFQEVRELQKWKADEDLFDETGLHPNDEGHAKLQNIVLDLWKKEGFPTGSAKALPSLTQPGGAVLTPQKTEMPSKRALGDDAGGASLDQRFANACEEVQELKQQNKLSIAFQSEIYGLYKQATEGDNKKPDPGFFSDPVVKGKWKAWNKCRGMTEADAKGKYVAKVKDMLPGGADGKRARRS